MTELTFLKAINHRIFISLLTIIFYFSISNAQSPYKSSWPKDGYIFGSGIVVGLIGLGLTKSISPLTVEEINNLSRDDVNVFDRPATYNYSVDARHLSDVVVVVCSALPATLLLSEKVRKDFGVFTVMYLQTLMFANVLPTFGKGRVVRTRPFVYNPDAPLEKKLEADARLSWYSGHTTNAFAGAVLFSTLYSNYFPKSKWKPFVWGGSLILASFVGYLRVEAGKHFPTDVLFGAAVGSAIGYVIPLLHRRKDDFDLSISAGSSRNNFEFGFNFKLYFNRN